MEFINNPKTEVTEQPIQGLARDMRVLGRDAKVASLSSFFKLSERAVTQAIVKDFTVLEKELVAAVKADARAGFRASTAAELGPKAKEISKYLTIKEILESKTVLKTDDIVKMIDRNKKNTRQLVAAEEARLAKNTGGTGGGTGGGSGGGTGTGGGTGGGTGPVPPVTGPRWKEWVKKNPYKTAAIALGALIPGYLIWNNSDDPNKGPAPKKSEGFPPCVAELIDKNKAQLFEEGGKGYAFIKTPKYPDGLKFYLDGTVINAKTGESTSYNCK